MLRIYEDALWVVKALVPVVGLLERRDPDLATQLKKARASISLNIAEGSHARGKRRMQHYSYAMGSANESVSVLHTAVASEYLAEVPDEIVARLRKIIGTLYRVIGGPS